MSADPQPKEPARSSKAQAQLEKIEKLVHTQNSAELHRRIDRLHPADIAYVLEGLPLEDRLVVWGLVGPDREGDVLLEVSDAVRDTLLADMDNAEIVAATQELDADESTARPAQKP